MPVVDKYRDMGTMVMGKSEQGLVQIGDVLQVRMNVSLLGNFHSSRCYHAQQVDNTLLCVWVQHTMFVSVSHFLFSVEWGWHGVSCLLGMVAPA